MAAKNEAMTDKANACQSRTNARKPRGREREPRTGGADRERNSQCKGNNDWTTPLEALRNDELPPRPTTARSRLPRRPSSRLTVPVKCEESQRARRREEDANCIRCGPPNTESVVNLPRVVRFSASVPFVETTVLLSGRGKTARLAALVHRVADPVDPRVAADSLVLRVDEDNLVVLVDAVLVDLQARARAKQEERERKSGRGRGGREKAAGRERRERGGGGRWRRPERYA